MHPTLKKVCDALDALAASVLAASGEDRTLAEVYGWHSPALDRRELAAMATDLAQQLKDADIDDIDETLLPRLETLQKHVKVVQSTTVQYLFNGNSQHAAPAYITALASFAVTLRPLFGWQVLKDSKAMPAALAKKLRYINSSLDEIVPKKDELQARIKQIEDATDAAESLPTDLESLKDARNQMEILAKAAVSDAADAEKSKNEAAAASNLILEGAKEARKLVNQCEEAYRITTTKGLAAAFDQRAVRLGWSMWVWVVGLLAALGTGFYFGSERIKGLTELVSTSSATAPNIWLHVVLSIFSIAAPVWFAWLATKQIGQRFRLSEDYAFKASVAKAYEGYRREAARICQR